MLQLISFYDTFDMGNVNKMVEQLDRVTDFKIQIFHVLIDLKLNVNHLYAKGMIQNSTLFIGSYNALKFIFSSSLDENEIIRK